MVQKKKSANFTISQNTNQPKESRKMDLENCVCLYPHTDFLNILFQEFKLYCSKYIEQEKYHKTQKLKNKSITSSPLHFGQYIFHHFAEDSTISVSCFYTYSHLSKKKTQKPNQPQTCISKTKTGGKNYKQET